MRHRRRSSAPHPILPPVHPLEPPDCPSPKTVHFPADKPSRVSRRWRLYTKSRRPKQRDKNPIPFRYSPDRDMASTMETFLSYLRVPVLASSGLAAILSGVLYFKQNEIIYPRNIPPGARTDIPQPPRFGISDFETLHIPTPDNESLHAFFIRPSNKTYGRTRNTTVLMFHGNAGNIGYRLPIAKVLSEDMGCNVFMLQYRGYGLSTGSPNEKGLMIDAQTGLDYIRQRAELRGTNIVLYGQSLGGAVSIALAANNRDKGDIKGMVLENTFLSIRKLIPSAFPPARYLAPLCHQIWASDEQLPKITNIPILFLSGLQDEIVPPSHMSQLFNLCKSELKIWREFPYGSHNDTVAEASYFENFDEFIRKAVLAVGSYSESERGAPQTTEKENAEK